MFLTYLFYIFQTLEIVSYEIKLTYHKDSLDFQRIALNNEECVLFL